MVCERDMNRIYLSVRFANLRLCTHICDNNERVFVIIKRQIVIIRYKISVLPKFHIKNRPIDRFFIPTEG